MIAPFVVTNSLLRQTVKMYENQSVFGSYEQEYSTTLLIDRGQWPSVIIINN